jgi:hypothetical protein
MRTFNTSFVFTHTREANDVSAYDMYIYAKGLWNQRGKFFLALLTRLYKINIELVKRIDHFYDMGAILNV